MPIVSWILVGAEFFLIWSLCFFFFFQYIPYKFAETYLNGNKGQVSLQVPDGRTWTLKFSVDVMGSGQHKAQFHNNWADFAQDNNLEVGDVCVFELIDCQKGSFKVSIFSAASDANSSPSPQGR